MAQLLQVTPRGTYKLDLNSGVLTFQDLRHSQTVLGALGPSSAINAYGTYSNALMEDKSQSDGIRTAGFEKVTKEAQSE
ncbi:MAG: hypothetical protein KDA96_19405, partial [Planctomycetaceae bacterium]|nr:hypothetical protein [Planctomycetaceae bacterium]